MRNREGQKRMQKIHNKNTKDMTYFICYNAKFIASRKSLRAAVTFIDARGIKDDENNELYITDQQGNHFSADGNRMEWI